MRLTSAILQELGARPENAQRYLRELNRQLAANGTDTPLRSAHFLAQVYHESGNMSRVSENLNYSTRERILAIFGSRIAASEADRFVRQPQRLANRVYANRIGNRNEASGDGWNYRGRGLIQLTGRGNYQAFSTWCGEDAVSAPDRVADDLAVLSAVYYWVTRDINGLADADDVRAVTRKVNGGLNGLDDRIRLLDRAKSLLRFDAPTELDEQQPGHRVTASSLNLRSAPRVSPSTFVATLAQGTPVLLLGPGGADGWVRVRALVGGSVVEGVVAERFIEPIPASVEPTVVVPLRPPAMAVPPQAHLSRDNRAVTRRRDGGRAHPLGEPRRPARNATTPARRARQLAAIALWLDTEAPAHDRYAAKRSTTFCNVYACDFCYLADAYLPRVWWKGTALERLALGESPPVQYGRSVEELTANRLHDWLHEFGPAYGWQHVQNLDVLQAAANAGDVCVITAQRQELDRAGHISIVLPEHDGIDAVRSARGEVRRPVESQAGRSNRRAGPPRSAWWRGARYRAFGFWRHP